MKIGAQNRNQIMIGHFSAIKKYTNSISHAPEIYFNELQNQIRVSKAD